MKEAVVKTWIISYIADFLMISESDIKSDSVFADLGLDSADAVIVSGALEEQFDIEIDATIFLRNPTIDDVIDDLRVSGYITDGVQ